MSKEYSFKPLSFKDTRILILGSFPSIKSFEKDFYYAHPSNQFWRLLQTITNYPVNNRDQKIWLLKKCKIGLWDMIKTCDRDSSFDSALENEKVNDLGSFLEENPNIKQVAFTGKKAEALFKTHFSYIEIDSIYLPSPSSAYASMSFEKKALIYREKLGFN